MNTPNPWAGLARAALRRFRGACKLLAFVLISSVLCAAAALQARAQAPSFTFTAHPPAFVQEGATFTYSATVTDVGGPAPHYNTFFQLYNSDFNYLGQDYFLDQSFATGTTLHYRASLTVPNTPGLYYADTLMFQQTFPSPIVGQQFFPFQVVQTVPAPEPSGTLPIGLLAVGVLVLTARARRRQSNTQL